MNKEEKLIRSYFDFDDINQTEPIKVLPLTLVDMLLEYKNLILNKNEFNFIPGDVIKFYDENYFVIENNGSTGIVCPIGETFYTNNFYWKLEDAICTFVRKPTLLELEQLGL